MCEHMYLFVCDINSTSKSSQQKNLQQRSSYSIVQNKLGSRHIPEALNAILYRLQWRILTLPLQAPTLGAQVPSTVNREKCVVSN